jgi:TPR repeat protein
MQSELGKGGLRKGSARGSIAALALLAFALVATDAARADGFARGAEAYADGSYSRAARLLAARAERGDARAQTYLGVMYLRGEGVPQNFEAAGYWLHAAAEAGVPAAQYFLGLMYDKGQGRRQDFVMAHAWLNLAAAHAAPRWRRSWTLIRDAVASKMSEAQLLEARRLAIEWRPETLR